MSLLPFHIISTGISSNGFMMIVNQVIHLIQNPFMVLKLCLKKKQKEIKAKQVKIEVKEIRFGPQTDEHDYDFKLKHAREFLEEGNKVKAYVFFKGRSIIFKEQGEVLLLRFANDLEEVGRVESMPELLGKRMTMFISPKKVPTPKKAVKTAETSVAPVQEKKITDKASAKQEKKGEYKMPTIEGEDF